jgi:hypothetical protein
MDRVRYVIGFVIGAFFMASAVAHSILGWRNVSGRLREAANPPDVVSLMALGWHLGGGAMFAFGCIVVYVFARFLRDRSSSLRVAQLIGIFYVAFGAWAVAESHLVFFVLMFVVPGLVLAVVSASRAASEARVEASY